MARGSHLLWSLLVLAACSGSPFPDNGGGGFGGGGGGLEENEIPDALAQNVQRIAFNPDTNTLSVELTGLDASPTVVRYRRNAALDVPGYRAFSVQEDALDRMFVALAAESADGSVEAAAVSDGGQFGEYYPGGYYRRNGGGAPSTGQVSYAGTYAGLTNLDAPGDNLLPIPPGTPNEVIPGEPARVRGNVFLNVNFADAAVNGVVFNRRFEDGGNLPSINLNLGDIDENGEFLGEVTFAADPEAGQQGSYGGIFGGRNGSSVAGVVSLDNLFLPEDPREEITGDFDREVGVFVLPRCNQAGAPAICDSVEP